MEAGGTGGGVGPKLPGVSGDASLGVSEGVSELRKKFAGKPLMGVRVPQTDEQEKKPSLHLQAPPALLAGRQNKEEQPKVQHPSGGAKENLPPASQRGEKAGPPPHIPARPSSQLSSHVAPAPVLEQRPSSGSKTAEPARAAFVLPPKPLSRVSGARELPHLEREKPTKETTMRKINEIEENENLPALMQIQDKINKKKFEFKTTNNLKKGDPDFQNKENKLETIRAVLDGLLNAEKIIKDQIKKMTGLGNQDLENLEQRMQEVSTKLTALRSEAKGLDFREDAERAQAIYDEALPLDQEFQGLQLAKNIIGEK